MPQFHYHLPRNKAEVFKKEPHNILSNSLLMYHTESKSISHLIPLISASVLYREKNLLNGIVCYLLKIFSFPYIPRFCLHVNIFQYLSIFFNWLLTIITVRLLYYTWNKCRQLIASSLVLDSVSSPRSCSFTLWWETVSLSEERKLTSPETS